MNKFEVIEVSESTKFEVGRQYKFSGGLREAIKEIYGFYPPDAVTCFDIQRPTIEARRFGPYIEWDCDFPEPTIGFSIPLSRYVDSRTCLRQFRINKNKLIEVAKRYRDNVEIRKELAAEKAKRKAAKKTPAIKKRDNERAAKQKAEEDFINELIGSLM